ncbi:hypothetical protein NDU88_006452 [Pleurodeles waltl]|uniref:Uncharacterized protein n=1 Tax=Pleurodeles waltl TaxID=8319 RepID=A0AAV7ME39_PLEWA|nr:hypothetical protein NDU88_006452 [Pleurodeles waltl]
MGAYHHCQETMATVLAKFQETQRLQEEQYLGIREELKSINTTLVTIVGVLKDLVNTRRDTVAQQGAPDTSLDDEQPQPPPALVDRRHRHRTTTPTPHPLQMENHPANCPPAVCIPDDDAISSPAPPDVPYGREQRAESQPTLSQRPAEEGYLACHSQGRPDPGGPPQTEHPLPEKMGGHSPLEQEDGRGPAWEGCPSHHDPPDVPDPGGGVSGVGWALEGITAATRG